MSGKPDIYRQVTNKIINDLERGNLTWLKPWQTSHAAGIMSRPLRANGKSYRGINILTLWTAALEKGVNCPIWLTYRQAVELGGQVRGGAKGSLVVYADRFTRIETGADGESIETEVPFMKGYTAFNAQQVEGLPAHFYAASHAQSRGICRLAALEKFFAAPGVPIRHGGNMAYYSPSHEVVQIPPHDSFRDEGYYFVTLGHEMIHATRHPKRLNRDFGQKRFGDQAYAMEELVAKIGAAFLCADLGITPETREYHAAYIASWLKVLKQDKCAIFTAASHAERATEHLRSYQSKEA